MPHGPALVRIVNEDAFSAYNAHIYDAETGKEFSQWVQRVDITLDANEGVPYAQVKVLFPVFDIVTKAEIEPTTIDMDDINSIAFAIVMLERRLKELTKEPPNAL